MNPFLSFFSTPIKRRSLDRNHRLRDLDARMSAFINEKQHAGETCPQVLNNVKTAKSKLRQEMSTT